MTERNATLPTLLTAREVAQQTRLPLARVYELSRRDEIPHIRLGRALRYDPRQVGEWLREGGTKP